MDTKLQELRKSKGISQKDVAKALGVTTGYYGMIELGKRKPSLKTAFQIANFFNKKVEDIFLDL